MFLIIISCISISIISKIFYSEFDKFDTQQQIRIWIIFFFCFLLVFLFLLLFKAVKKNNNKMVFNLWQAIMLIVIVKFTLELLVYPKFLHLDNEIIQYYIYFVYIYELFLILTYSFWSFFVLKYCMKSVYKQTKSTIVALL